MITLKKSLWINKSLYMIMDMIDTGHHETKYLLRNIDSGQPKDNVEVSYDQLMSSFKQVKGPILYTK